MVNSLWVDSELASTYILNWDLSLFPCLSNSNKLKRQFDSQHQ